MPRAFGRRTNVRGPFRRDLHLEWRMKVSAPTSFASSRPSISSLADMTKPCQRSGRGYHAAWHCSLDQRLVSEPLPGNTIDEAIQPVKGVAAHVAFVEFSRCVLCASSATFARSPRPPRSGAEAEEFITDRARGPRSREAKPRSPCRAAARIRLTVVRVCATVRSRRIVAETRNQARAKHDGEAQK
jgi:hypothetical protein